MREPITREETKNKLKQLYEKGYRYVVRDKEMPYLVCFSLKPKRYLAEESWGYKSPDLQNSIPAYPIKNTDVSEVNWSNRSATLISDFVKLDLPEGKRSLN